MDAEQKLVLLLTDGWYITCAVSDETVQKRIWSGKMIVGQKISLVGSSLLSRPQQQPFFFGDADELGSSVLRISANGVMKTANQAMRLGIHPQPRARTIRSIRDDAGTGPPLAVVVLRTYPAFYMEKASEIDKEGEEKITFISRREDGEDEAREEHEEKHQQKLEKDVENQKSAAVESELPDRDPDPRNVRCVQDLLVCGLDDNPVDSGARKSIRIYNISDGLRNLLSSEGRLLLLSQVWPKKNSWTCKPDGVRELRDTTNVGTKAVDSFPRQICSVSELQHGVISEGDEFDGVFHVLHITASDKHSRQRFAYLTDQAGETITVLALQLCESDSICLPRSLRFKRGLRPQFPLVGLRDAQYCSFGEKYDLIHAKATLRTSIMSSRTIGRQDESNTLRIAHGQLQAQLRGKEAQLEILRDAVISFASGNRGSIGAYFTSTPDV